MMTTMRPQMPVAMRIPKPSKKKKKMMMKDMPEERQMGGGKTKRLMKGW